MEKTKLSVKAFTLTAAILWGGCILFVGIVNLVSPEYGLAFLNVVSSIYPGYHVAQGMISILIGSTYALLDGAVAGLIFALIYNCCLRCSCKCSKKESSE